MMIARVPESDGGVPLVMAVSLSESKRHCNVYHANDDDLITAMIRVAQSHMEGHDGTGGTLGRAVSQHTLDLKFERWPANRAMALPHPPLVSVTSIKYLDIAGVEQTFPAINYHVVSDTISGFVRLKSQANWPSLDIAPDAVRVRFVAGPSECPVDLKHAMLLHVGHLYLNREAVGETTSMLPFAYKALTDPHKTHGWI